MKSRFTSAFGIAVLSLTLAAPAYAYTGTANGGNGGLGNGMGTPSAESHIHAQSTGSATGHEISVYDTGTGSQFRNINPANTGTDSGRGDYTNRTPAGTYRTTAANPTRNAGWAWLGLLGLFGLIGLRNRNPQGNR